MLIQHSFRHFKRPILFLARIMRHVMIWTFGFSFTQLVIFGKLKKNFEKKRLVSNRKRNYSFKKGMLRNLGSHVS